MKKSLLLLFISISNFLFAQNKQTVYEQLVSINKQWKNIQDIDPTLKQTIAKELPEQQLIQFHLQQVELLLRKRNTTNLSAIQKKQRTQNLNQLHNYLEEGVFPINDAHINRQPYFIDKYNTYCAVGYLMKMSGADKMAKEIHETQNYSYLLDIKHSQLTNWVTNSGFTLDELALIQPAYGDTWRASLTEIHYNNTGTDVNEYIELHQFHGAPGTGGIADSLIFYDQNGIVYKRLAVSSMSSFTKENHPFLYYSFPANEPFADKGKVEIKGTIYIVSNILLQTITYNDVSITITNSLAPTPVSIDYNFSIGENENTPIGTSLNYCDSSMIQSSATIGLDAPCLNLAVPISLSKLDYTINNKKVTLNWETASETNNNYFFIEKSTDGINFKTIGKVNGVGTSNNVSKYSFVDEKPNFLNQYRLKQIDFDGKFSYSKIIFVKVQTQNILSILNNPIKNILQYSISEESLEKNFTIVVYDLMGKKLKSFNTQSGTQKMDVSNLKSGKYLLQLTTNKWQVFNALFIKLD